LYKNIAKYNYMLEEPLRGKLCNEKKKSLH
jgi:hypothetical protein